MAEKTKKTNACSYHETKLKPLVKIIAGIVQRNPSIADDPDYLMATISSNIPNFLDKTKCINCGASMAEYLYPVTIFEALLLYSMAQKVREKVDKGVAFTEANVTHVPSLDNASYTVKSRTGFASKLGIIAKHKKDGKHVSGQWAITTRGWQALRGMPIPKEVKVFRAQILERTEETITLAEVFRKHTDRVIGLLARKKVVKKDWRSEYEQYEPNEWVHIAGMHEGDII